MNDSGRRLSVHHFLTYASLKPMCQLNSNSFGLVKCFMPQSTVMVMSRTFSSHNHTVFHGQTGLSSEPLLLLVIM